MPEQNESIQSHGDDHQRAVELFTFLKNFIKLRSKISTSYEQFEKTLWLKELLPANSLESLFESSKSGDGTRLWFTINKPSLASPPPVPQQLFPWIDPDDLQNPSLEAPSLRASLPVPGLRLQDDEIDQYDVRLYTEVKDELEPLWQDYLNEHWKPWAQRERKKPQQLRAYSDLFSLYLRQQKLGEGYQVVCAVGLLQWQKEEKTIRRHLITLPVSLSFDPRTSQIRVFLPPDASGFQLETEMLDGIDLPPEEILNSTNKRLSSLKKQAEWAATIQSILREWCREMPLNLACSENLNPVKLLPDQPAISLSPALILRKRPDQPLLRMIDEILRQLESGQAPSALVQHFVGENRFDSFQESAAQSPGADVYFPLPFNEEQLSVLEKFRTSPGMLVKGPPGTGKSHTIANLICQFLAEGKRVLVTSQTARALKVLRNKIPDSFRVLSAVLLGNGERGEAELEKSVSAIYDRFQQWDLERSEQEIERLRSRLDEQIYQERQVFKKLTELREQETYEHLLVAGGYSGTLQKIAQELQLQEADYRWMPDRPDYQQDPPLTNEEAVELLHLLRTIPASEAERFAKIELNQNQLPSGDDIEHFFKKEAEAKKRLSLSLEELQQIGLTNLPELPGTFIETLLEQVNRVIQKYDLIDQSSYPWLRKAASDVLGGRIKVWEALQAITEKNLAYLKEHFQHVAEWQVSGLRGRYLKTVMEHASRMNALLIEKGKIPPPLFRGKRLREAMYICEAITINGSPCDTAERIQQLLEYLEVSERLQSLAQYWSHHLEISSKTPVSIQFAEYESLESPLNQVIDLHREFDKLIKMLEEHRDIEIAGLQNITALRKLAKILSAGRERLQLLEASKPIEELAGQVESWQQGDGSLPELTSIANALKFRDIQGYRDAWQTLNRRMEIKITCERRQQLWNTLASAAPLLAQELEDSYEDPIWEQRLKAFTAAWDWARAEFWLEKHAVTEERELQESQLTEIKRSIKTLRDQLAVSQAWHHCFVKMTDQEREHLLAWKKAITRLGKGTGHQAEEHRQQAREHLSECQPTIPAWVMPIYQIAENLTISREMFDVVIIDEASQSGPEALLLTFLAKRMIVVGDDQQISPDYVGVRKEIVEQLRQKYLRQIPHHDVIGIEHSFFDLAEIRFSKQVSLREHFRCMPEIIHFSNLLCYPSQPLIPLRQFGFLRLTPTVVTRFVECDPQHAARHKGINIDEIEALVAEVKHCVQDRRYEGKTMGIISLQGIAQARAIEKLLVKELGPEEIEKRNILCGDPYSFQGDERDVIFLSLVTAPGQKRRALNLPNDRRRLNVAVSRARDQVWLFHSVRLEELAEKDLRYRLLEYFLEPELPAEEVYTIDIAKLNRLAMNNQRDNYSPPHPFDNWFEVDLFLKLREKGIPVSPQVQVDTYFLDLVIEGNRGKIAIECEGDQWDGADFFAKVWEKLQMLERCGWNVIRIRGSEFYRNPEKALEPVLEAVGFSLKKKPQWTVLVGGEELLERGSKQN